MKHLKVSGMIVLLFIFSFNLSKTMAQCDPSKYGIAPNWPIIWDLQEQADWFQEMSNHGMGFLHSAYNWRQLQEMVDSHQFISFRDRIAYEKANYGFDKYLFQFQNPATVSNSMPPVYCGSPLTNPGTTTAMYNFVCMFLDSMHDVIDYFAFGGETDVYFKTRPAERDSFVVLANRISNYIDNNYPSIKFGVVVTFHNGIQNDPTIWNMVKPFSDMLVVTYWPISSNFVLDPANLDSVQYDISDLLAAAGSMPVVIKECGLPTATELGSSDSLQAKFVRETFIHTMNIPQIEAVGFDFLSDFDTTKIYWYQNYYITYDPDFYYYISSLGLMDTLGNPKYAYPVYLAMLDTVCLHNSLAEHHSAKKFQVYPNPFCGQVNILASEFHAKTEYIIRSTNGAISAQGRFRDSRLNSIDIQQLENGVYMLEISIDEKFETERHIIIKSCIP
ncbi:MAG: hypothetical protein CVU11_11965 [Bacteroidetes bacterium HGW-Bacteroidetes-6]|jgi:hypothetical protein|nr:MAG: hypothetical protein CVU11_11965 [Bacteroidetes bacterium HGW-Bacteroidetes-6]